MHFFHDTKLPNLKWKTQPKQLLGSPPEKFFKICLKLSDFSVTFDQSFSFLDEFRETFFSLTHGGPK